ncbi:MAG: DUF3747 domain-containing protein, partial [Leptolyngbyaceae cyanobacterium bins.59]|nr:DUF3747 domain-containing protein [Leptolyngbyaceae cyanobacterium bins.59]
MKFFFPSVLITLLGVASIAPLYHAETKAAVTFSQQEVQQESFIVLAAPRGQTAYNLLILEQISNRRLCWRVRPDRLQTVDPLLRNFNFTGICGRSTDSNAFSIRMAGEDLALNYTLRLVQREGVVVLVGTPADRTLPEITLGRTRGITRDFMKIDLEPGWRLTRRLFQGRPLGHIYLTNNTDLRTYAAEQADIVVTRPSPTPSPLPTRPGTPPLNPPPHPTPEHPPQTPPPPAKP